MRLTAFDPRHPRIPHAHPALAHSECTYDSPSMRKRMTFHRLSPGSDRMGSFQLLKEMPCYVPSLYSSYSSNHKMPCYCRGMFDFLVEPGCFLEISFSQRSQYLIPYSKLPLLAIWLHALALFAFDSKDNPTFYFIPNVSKQHVAHSFNFYCAYFPSTL